MRRQLHAAAAIVVPRAEQELLKKFTALVPVWLLQLAASVQGEQLEEEMANRHCGGFGLLCVVCAGVLACLLPPPAGAADGKWQANPGRHDGNNAAAPHHAGLPPPPTAGADLPPTQPAPHFGFPLQPTLGSAASPAAGEGYPFIGSNPTVPLPTGVTDTATVLPLPDTKVVGRAATVRAQLSMIGLGVVFAVVLLSTSC